jgi:hypothetical protein
MLLRAEVSGTRPTRLTFSSSRVLEDSHLLQHVTASLHMGTTACRKFRHMHVGGTETQLPLFSLPHATTTLDCFLAQLVGACCEKRQSLEATYNIMAAAQHPRSGMYCSLHGQLSPRANVLFSASNRARGTWSTKVMDAFGYRSQSSS